MVNKFPTVLFVCMLKNLWREKGMSVNRWDFKLSVALYLAQQLCCIYFLGPSSLVIGLCTIIFLLLFVFPTNPVCLRSSSGIIQWPNLGQVLPPQEVIMRSGGSRPSDRGGGGGGNPDPNPDPKVKWGTVSKKLFPALWASVWSQYKGGPPLDCHWWGFSV